MDKIILIHGGETVARIECNTAYTNELFQSAAEMVVDYVIATTADDGVLWVADGMTEQVWEPESTNPEDTRRETLDQFPELVCAFIFEIFTGKW